MNRIVLSLLLFCISGASYAQLFSPQDYIYPLENVARLYSASFGELRSDHFHSGVDIKTDGVIGKKVVAVADGYVSRISVSPYGYGLALYVAHRNGSTTVYGHLSRFNDEIAKYIETERYRTRSNTVNIYCDPSTFVVKQGDVIAYSGNTGSSAGPHLHFEVRESGQQKPINPIAQGIITPNDNIAPLMFKLHYIETDSLQGIVRSAPRRSYDLVKTADTYGVVGNAKISVGRQGYFVLEASDRRPDVTNTFGIYRLVASVDDSVFFEYEMNGFTYDKTRYCNAIGYYPIMINTRNEALRIGSTENTDRSHYPKLVNGGVVTSAAGEAREVKIKIYDDCGNTSQCSFTILGKADELCFKATEVEPRLIIKASKAYEYSGDGVCVSIPANTLYESTVFSCTKIERSDSTALSDTYQVLDITTPLHQAMTVSIAAKIPYELQSKVGLVCVGRSSYPTFIRGDYISGRVIANSRNAGKYHVAVDTKGPTLKLGITEGSQQAGSSYFTCAISDDLSGVKSYRATIDGEWIALDLDKGRLRHDFREKPTGATHTLVVEATDGVGNKSTVRCSFVR